MRSSCLIVTAFPIHPITVFIPAPNKVNTLFTMIKPFLKSETTTKIKIFGKNDEKWREAILKDISPDQLRQRYGGTMPDDAAWRNS